MTKTIKVKGHYRTVVQLKFICTILRAAHTYLVLKYLSTVDLYTFPHGRHLADTKYSIPQFDHTTLQKSANPNQYTSYTLACSRKSLRQKTGWSSTQSRALGTLTRRSCNPERGFDLPLGILRHDPASIYPTYPACTLSFEAISLKSTKPRARRDRPPHRETNIRALHKGAIVHNVAWGGQYRAVRTHRTRQHQNSKYRRRNGNSYSSWRVWLIPTSIRQGIRNVRDTYYACYGKSYIFSNIRNSVHDGHRTDECKAIFESCFKWHYRSDQTETKGLGHEEVYRRWANLLTPISIFDRERAISYLKSGFISIAPTAGLDPEAGFVIPENFALVWNGVYRSSFPKEETFEFVRHLKLKSILLVP